MLCTVEINVTLLQNISIVYFLVNLDPYEVNKTNEFNLSTPPVLVNNVNNIQTPNLIAPSWPFKLITFKRHSLK